MSEAALSYPPCSADNCTFSLAGKKLILFKYVKHF